MIQKSKRSDGVRVESIHRRRIRAHNKSKITPIDDENNYSKISYINSWLASSEIINSDNTLSITQKELSSLNSATNRSEKHIPAENNTIVSNNNTLKRQPQGVNQSWKYILMILYGVLCILLLIALILPSIFVYILAPTSSPTTGLSLSPQNSSHCAGISSNSLWQMDSTTTITMQIDTSECNFNMTPLYITSIAGVCSHSCLTGYDAIYLPTKQSFQVYTRYSCGVWNATDLLNSAQTCGWDVNWMGFF